MDAKKKMVNSFNTGIRKKLKQLNVRTPVLGLQG